MAQAYEPVAQGALRHQLQVEGHGALAASSGDWCHRPLAIIEESSPARMGKQVGTRKCDVTVPRRPDCSHRFCVETRLGSPSGGWYAIHRSRVDDLSCRAPDAGEVLIDQRIILSRHHDLAL